MNTNVDLFDTKALFLSRQRLIATVVILLLLTCASAIAQTMDVGAYEEEFLFFSEEDIASIATFARKPITRSPGSISVVTAKMIANMAARNLVDVLRTLPGFDVRYSNFGEYFVSVRGVDNPSNILVLINGHRFNDFYSGAALYDIPVDNIERIEVIRGTGSALYGTNAMVGVVNVITKKETGFKAKAGAGTYDTYKGNLQFGNEGEEWRVYGFAEIYNTAGADEIISADRLTTINRFYSKTPGRMKDNKEKISGRLDAAYRETEFGLNFYREERGPNIAYLDIYSDKSKVVSDYVGLDVARNFDVAESTGLATRVYADRWLSDKKIQMLPDDYVDLRDLDGDGSLESFPNGAWLNQSYESWTYGADLRLTHNLSQPHTLTAGVTLEQMELRNTDVSTNYSGEPGVDAIASGSYGNWNQYDFPKKSRTIYAFYLQDDWAPTTDVNIVAGARYDHYSDFGDTVNPRVALNFSPVDKVDLKVQYATAFRAPTFKELYDETDTQFFGNPDLSAEKIETIELGAGYTFKKNTFIKGNLFQNNIKDDISSVLEFSRAGITRNQNIGRQEIKGWELEAKYTFKDDSSIYANTTTFNVKDKVSDTWLTRIPQLRGNVMLTKNLPMKSRATATWMYIGPATSNARTNAEKLPQNRAETGPFNLVNMAFVKDDLFMGIRLKISVFNLLNIDYKELYPDIRYRMTNPLGSVGIAAIEPGLMPSNHRAFLFEIAREF